MKKLYGNQCIFIFSLLIGGIMTGIIGSIIADTSLFNSLDALLIPISTVTDPYNFFLTTFLQQILFIITICFISTSAIGILPLSFIVFIKGVQVGCTSVLFIITYQLKGIAGIVLTLLPLAFIDIIPIIIMSLYAIDLSTHILYACINHEKINIKKELNAGLNHLLVSFITVLFFSFCKATIIIELIRLFISF